MKYSRINLNGANAAVKVWVTPVPATWAGAPALCFCERRSTSQLDSPGYEQEVV